MVYVAREKIAPVLLLLAFAATTSACSLGPHGCTEAACTSSITANVSDDALFGEAQLLRACFNGTCVEMDWAMRPNECETKVQVPLTLTNCFYPAEGVNIRLEPRDDFKLADGDTYELTIEGRDGDILDESRQVAYEDVYPNGEDCPGHCRSAEIEF